MGSKKALVSSWKCVLAAATALLAPSLWGQRAVLVSSPSPSLEALPAALSASRPAAAATEVPIIRIADPVYSKPLRPIAVRNEHATRNWFLLSAASSAAASFDAYTTRRAISSGAVELDPLMKPFANSNAIYAAIQASPLVLDFAAYRMQRSGNPFLRRMWWLPQSVGTAMSLTAGVHNLGYAH